MSANPHAGLPITGDDATIAAALEDLSVPTPMVSLKGLIETGHKAMEPRQSVHDEYSERTQRELETLVWSSPHVKHSWYKNAHGRIHILSPWRLVDDWAWTREPDLSDYELS